MEFSFARTRQVIPVTRHAQHFDDTSPNRRKFRSVRKRLSRRDLDLEKRASSRPRGGMLGLGVVYSGSGWRNTDLHIWPKSVNCIQSFSRQTPQSATQVENKNIFCLLVCMLSIMNSEVVCLYIMVQSIRPIWHQ